VLLSLAHEFRHGYAIMKDVEAMTDGRIVFSTGTLYGVLKRFLEQDWIIRLDTPAADNRAQKTYELTDKGRKILGAEIQRMQSLLNAVHLRIQKDSL
jgi:DNA-binding PadR family transcriptional regulator